MLDIKSIILHRMNTAVCFSVSNTKLLKDLQDIADDIPTDYKNLISSVLVKSSNCINKFIQETLNGSSQCIAD